MDILKYPELILRYNDDAINRQKCTKAHGVMGEPMPKSAFLAVHESTMKSTMKNVGYLYGTSIHIIRREVATVRFPRLVTSAAVWSSRACRPIANFRDNIERYTEARHT